MRFELIDRVVEREPERLTAIKTVSLAEEYLADHFPGFPVLPGVMMLEALVQAGRELAAGLDPAAAGPLVLAEVRNVKYGQMVRPGQALHVQVTLRGRDDAGLALEGRGTVDGELAVAGRFRLLPARAHVAGGR
ncbi:MAG: 3-hydroxyacyl-ACP dehydratase FabZ family protein [Phycisphaeraceae bacterium]